MKKDVIDKKIAYILRKLSELEHISLEDDSNNVTKLYGKYLKLLVQMENIASLDSLLNGNCYFYALGLPMPVEFKKMYSLLTNHDYRVNIGELGGYKDLYTVINPVKSIYHFNNLIEALNADLDFLKIKQYESSIDELPKHGGFKIMIFSDDDRKKGDYHLARQSQNGIWTHKIGYYNKEIVKTSDILGYMDNFNRKQDTNYEYVKTLELVKPVIYRK